MKRPCCIRYTVQTRAEGERLYFWYNTDANGLYSLWNVSTITFVFFNNLKWMIFGEKIKPKVYVNQHDFCISDIQTPSRLSDIFCVFFMNYLWVSQIHLLYLTRKRCEKMQLLYTEGLIHEVYIRRFTVCQINTLKVKV
jgi:hypothetical protein